MKKKFLMILTCSYIFWAVMGFIFFLLIPRTEALGEKFFFSIVALTGAVIARVVAHNYQKKIKKNVPSVNEQLNWGVTVFFISFMYYGACFFM